MILYSYFYILFNFVHFCTGKFKSAQCRDHGNKPVDWWFMYKLPFDPEYGKSSGRNYLYIKSDSLLNWQMAPKSISQSAMLFYTLAPLFRSDVTKNIAYAVMDDKKATGTFPGCSLKGLFVADTESGFFLGHTIPDFPDVSRGKVHIPSSEMENSHLLFCMSLTPATMSDMIETMRLAMPRIVSLYVPQHMVSVVPAFGFGPLQNGQFKLSPVPYEFGTLSGLLQGTLIVRRPGDDACIYSSYAKKKFVYLDVYSPDDKPKDNFCATSFGVRNIESISLKTRDILQASSFVQYVKNTTDPVRIAMTTAAHWQKTGRAQNQYTACVGSLDRDDTSGRSGILFCVDGFHPWRSFDNFKVKEPSC